MLTSTSGQQSLSSALPFQWALANLPPSDGRPIQVGRVLRRFNTTNFVFGLLCLGCCFVISAFATACTNEHLAFCEETGSDFCERCYACGETDEEASRLCGFETTVDKAGCIELLDMVCTTASSDYNTEAGRACSDRVSKLSCDKLAESGKPEVCSRLF